jgi:hypothetical protein
MKCSPRSNTLRPPRNGSVTRQRRIVAWRARPARRGGTASWMLRAAQATKPTERRCIETRRPPVSRQEAVQPHPRNLPHRGHARPDGRSISVTAVTNWSGRQGRRGRGWRCWPRSTQLLAERRRGQRRPQIRNAASAGTCRSRTRILGNQRMMTATRRAINSHSPDAGATDEQDTGSRRPPLRGFVAMNNLKPGLMPRPLRL